MVIARARVQCRFVRLSCRFGMTQPHRVCMASLNPVWLEDFLALAATVNFSRAAEARAMTQPAFSRRVRALEAWLGVELIDRRVQPSVLTDAGAWFVNTAREQLARIERLPADARAVADARAATLRFAATHALSLTFVPTWLRGLEDRMPTVPIELTSDVLQRCEDGMLERRIDFVLCHAHPEVHGRLDHDFASAVVGHDVLMPVSAPVGRGRAARPSHRLDVDGVPVLAFSAASGLGRIVAALRGGALDKVGARIVFTAHLATVLRGMALDGRGVAWLPQSLIDADLTARRLLPAAPASWRIPLDIRIFRSDVAHTPAVQALWSAITSARAAPVVSKQPARRHHARPPASDRDQRS